MISIKEETKPVMESFFVTVGTLVFSLLLIYAGIRHSIKAHKKKRRKNTLKIGIMRNKDGLKRIYKVMNQSLKKQVFFTGKTFNRSYNKIYGNFNGTGIELERIKENDFDDIRITVSYETPGEGLLRITRDRAWALEKIIRNLEDYATGDRDFDSLFLVHSTNDSLVHLLNSKIRSNITNLSTLISNYKNFEITEKQIILEASYVSLSDQHKLESLLESVFSISGELSLDHQKNLIGSYDSETIPAIRKNIITILAHRFPGDEETTALLARALNDVDREIQIEAALHLKEKGMRHLGSMLQWADDISDRDLLSIITILRKNHHQVEASYLINIYTKTSNAAVKMEILNFFKILRDPLIPGFLTDLLEGSTRDTRFQLIETLGECGTVDSVEKLYCIGKETVNPFTKNAVQKSIFKIQSRAGTVDKGWLSINKSSKKEGSLSISDQAEAGALSLKGKL
ncbi:MAG: hypothetical protein GY754_36620 [bacterium]|nr:hypothetical protein [bacterium]